MFFNDNTSNFLASNKLPVFLKDKSEPNLYNLEQTEKRPKKVHLPFSPKNEVKGVFE